jgi:hypothetical protein
MCTHRAAGLFLWVTIPIERIANGHKGLREYRGRIVEGYSHNLWQPHIATLLPICQYGCVLGSLAILLNNLLSWFLWTGRSPRSGLFASKGLRYTHASTHRPAH